MAIARDWHEDDEFWELVEPFMFDQNRRLAAATEIDQALRLVRLPESGTVLDLCCGPGRHSIELARRGYRVTGVDRTRRYLELANSRKGTLEIEFVLADAREFDRPDTFDLAINLYTSFGYFESLEDDERVALNLYRSLKPGGSLLMQLAGKEVVGRGFQERDWLEKDGTLLIDERRIVPPFAAVENQWTLIQGEERKEVGFIVRLYSATELEALLKRAGFDRVRFFGSYEGLPYDQNAQRLVAVATK